MYRWLLRQHIVAQTKEPAVIPSKARDLSCFRRARLQ